MRDREKFIINIIVGNVIVRILKKISSKSVQGFRSYGPKSGQNGCPSTFLRIFF